MSGLLSFSRAVDGLNRWIGAKTAWLILVAVLISAANAIVRKLFNVSSNAYLELQWVLFGAVFLFCAPWTLMANEHIRIDILSSRLPKRVRDGIDVVGHALFLLPLCLIMVWHSVPFFLRSLNINEQSLSAGGLPQWPAKSFVLIGFALLLLQALSELIKRVAAMRGLAPDPYAGGGGHHAAAEAEASRLIALAETERLEALGAPLVHQAEIAAENVSTRPTATVQP